MAESALKMEEMEVPDGGIADFVMSDEDADAVYGPDKESSNDNGEEEAVEENGGISQFSEIAKKMAVKGRGGDDVVAHLQTGELVIPKALLDKDPAWRESILKYLSDKGVENPEQYIVGSDENSLNPDTGIPEFFFKSVFKAVSKAVSSVAKTVVKVVKKVAPVVLPIALSFALGPVYGAALGSGISTLINGGSIGDAFKSALISGATGAITSGISSSLSGGTFMEGLTQPITDPTASAAALRAKVSNAAQSVSDFFSGTPTTAGAEAAGAVSSSGAPVTAEQAYNAATAFEVGDAPVGIAAGASTPLEAQQLITAQTPDFYSSTSPSLFDNVKEYGTKAGDYLFRGGSTEAEVAAAQEAARTAAMDKEKAYLLSRGINPDLAQKMAIAAGEKAAAAAGPNLLMKYGPSAALAGGALLAGGAFTAPPQEPPNVLARDAEGNVITGQTLIAQRPQDFLVSDLGSMVLNPQTGQYEMRGSQTTGTLMDLQPRMPTYSGYISPTRFGLGSYMSPYPTYGYAAGPFRRPVAAAEGGAIFPRRNGGIMPDEGTPNKDSVRAMLMPGEFVMTTDAVRGAGGGDLKRGIRNMYSIMRGLERRGRGAA